MFSKTSAYISVVVMAAISVGVGCADGSRKVSQRKTLQGKAGQKDTVTQVKLDKQGNVIKDKSGNPVMETVPRTQARDKNAPSNTANTANGADPTFTPTGAEVKRDAKGNVILDNMNVPETDKNLGMIETAEKEQASGKVLTRDELPAGKYSLKSVQTSALIDANRVNEKTRAIQNNTLIPSGNQGRGFTLDNSSDKNSAGFLTAVFNDKTRQVDIPASFSKPAGKWTPDRMQASNMSFENEVTVDGDGKAFLTNRLANENSNNPVSILGILNAGVLQQDKSYRYQDEGSVIYLRLLQKSETQVTAYMAFEEQRQAKGSKVNFDRAMFFTFEVAPDNSKTANTDDTFNVRSSTTGESL